MNTMLIVIGAVIFLVILVSILFVIKRRQVDINDASLTVGNRPKTLAEQQLELNPQEQFTSISPTTPAVPSVEETLTAVNQHLNQQDYGIAANLLKEAIKHHPRKSELQVQLLNVFAQSKNYDNFNRFYQQILKINDPQTIKEANALKNLMDEEYRLAHRASVTPSRPVQVVEGFDFDFFDKTEQNPVTPSAIEPTNTLNQSDALDFDLMFETPISPSKSETVSSIKSSNANVGNDDGIDFDFDIGSPTLSEPAANKQPVDVDKEIKLPDGGELRFDDFSDFSPKHDHTQKVASPVSAEATVNESTDFDFKFNDLDSPLSTPIEEPTLDTSSKIPSDKAEFISDISDFDPNTSSAPTIKNPTADSVDKIADEFDFNFDTPATVAKPTLTETDQNETIASISKSIDDEFNFDFELPTSPAKTTQEFQSKSTLNTNPVTSSDNQLFSDFDSVEDLSNAPVSQEILASGKTLFDANSPAQHATQEQTSSATPTTAKPVSDEDFSLLKNVDTIQLNVDLAAQYINLGEYDSAKRLLNEINTADNERYQYQIQQLLEKIS